MISITSLTLRAESAECTSKWLSSHHPMCNSAAFWCCHIHFSNRQFSRQRLIKHHSHPLDSQQTVCCLSYHHPVACVMSNCLLPGYNTMFVAWVDITLLHVCRQTVSSHLTPNCLLLDLTSLCSLCDVKLFLPCLCQTVSCLTWHQTVSSLLMANCLLPNLTSLSYLCDVKLFLPWLHQTVCCLVWCHFAAWRESALWCDVMQWNITRQTLHVWIRCNQQKYDEQSKSATE